MPAKNQKTIDQLLTQAITEFSKTLELFGLTPTEARLFVTLYIQNRPMTLDEMSEALGKSKTAMSNGIRSLLDLNLVERVWKKGVRKDLYQAEDQLFRKFMVSYTQKWLESVDSQKQTLQQIENELNESIPSTENQDFHQLSARIQNIIRFHQLLEDSFHRINPN